ncbi:DUF736 domain-containing protein [Caulobacter sp. LARHSG274]
MAMIGEFKPSKAGGWEGEIRTLYLSAKVRLEPNDNRSHPNAPALRVFAGKAHVGDAWEHHSRGEVSKTYYRVSFDDPLFAAPIWASLFLDADELSAQLVWARPLKPKEPRPLEFSAEGAAGAASEVETARRIDT